MTKSELIRVFGTLQAIGDLFPEKYGGPLTKGASLCHGTAGNGYAFLKLFARTGNPLWLERARAFAMVAVEQVEAARAALGRGRYSLWTGDIGTALYLRACLVEDATFPTIDVL